MNGQSVARRAFNWFERVFEPFVIGVGLTVGLWMAASLFSVVHWLDLTRVLIVPPGMTWLLSPGFVLWPAFVPLVLYGAFRAVSMNPLYNGYYADWLSVSCYAPPRPLPFGPMTLSWPDALVLAFVMLLVAPVGAYALPLALIALLAPYLWYMRSSLKRSGKRWTDFYLGLTACCFLPGFYYPWHVACLMVLAYFVAAPVLVRCLDMFRRPLGIKDLAKFFVGGGLMRPWAEEPAVMFGWPMAGLAPFNIEEARESRSEMARRVAMQGWAVGMICWSIDLTSEGDFWAEYGGSTLAVVLVAVLATCGFRLRNYLSAWGSPIGFWGRFRVHWGIIPEYDIVFIGPLLYAVAPVPLLLKLWSLHVPPPIALGIVAFVASAIHHFCPPDPVTWHLTGKAAMRRKRKFKAEHTEL